MLLGFLIGLFIGATIGYFAAALMFISKEQEGFETKTGRTATEPCMFCEDFEKLQTENELLKMFIKDTDNEDAFIFWEHCKEIKKG